MSDRIGTNSGHGHVWPRPDGMVATCGGPGFCRECMSDEMLVTEAGLMPFTMQNADGHPILVQIGENPLMRRWDIQVIVGNFATEGEATQAAKAIGKMLEREIGASSNQLQ